MSPSSSEVGSFSARVTPANALRNRFNISLPQLKLDSNDWAPSSICIPRPTQIEADVCIPTEVELFLLFCSLFPRGFRLPIEDLVMYGMALNLFGDVHNMSQARCRVYNLIMIINHRLPPYRLNKLCLWEEEYGDRYIKILDTALDLAKSIASKYRLAFCPESVKRAWPSTDWGKYFYGLSLVLRRINQHPVNLEYPKLAFLQLQHREGAQSFPVDLFEGIKELLVLSLDVLSLPLSIYVLSNLRMLRLKVHRFEDMSCIGILVNLEFLSISTPSLTDIPKEMGLLGNLRLLDLRNMNIAWIPPGVLSRMLKLEELYLPLSFRKWGCRAQEEHDDYDDCGSWEEDDCDDKERINASMSKINDGKRINAAINEIVSCSLNALQVVVPKASILPKRTPIFKNMQRFKILVPNNLKYRPLGKHYSLNVLQLTGDAYDIKESGICDLMSRTEDLNLTRVRNLKNVMFKLEDCDFPRLQKMIISECDELEYVVDTTEKQILSEDDYLFSKLESLHLSVLSNLKEIWHGRWAKLGCFENLSQISIRFCQKLKYVFPLSIVKGCALLKTIEILNCNDIEGIFYQDEEDDNSLVHCFVEELDLHSLPKLVGFLVRNDTTADWVHDGTHQKTTNEIMSNSTAGSRLNENCVDNEELICPPPTSVSLMEKYDAFSSKLTEKWLQNLKRLRIAFCHSVEVVFLFEDDHVTTAAFNSLKELELYGLRSLIHIWFSVPAEIIAFQNLQLLILSECQNLYLFTPRVAKLLVQLQKVYVNRCDKMEEIILEEDENERENNILFPQLKLLEFQHMPNLRKFSSGSYPIELPALESVKFNECSKMESFSYGSLLTPMLKRIQINGSLYSILGDLNATMKRYKTGNCGGIPSDDANPSSVLSSNSSNPSSIISSIGPPTVGSSNYTYSEPSTIASQNSAAAANEANEEETSNVKEKSSTNSRNSPTSEGSSNGSCSESSSTGSSNYIYSEPSTIASQNSAAANEPNGEETSNSFCNSATPEGSSNGSCSESSSTGISIPTSQCSIAASEANEEANLYGQVLEGPNYMKEFSFADLKIATKNFSLATLLGVGGFGSVYKGWLNEKTFAPSKTCTGMAVAIKRCSRRRGLDFQAWQTEVKVLERQFHPNLIKFIGCCLEERELLLVYEFIPRGSLYDHLHKRNPEIEPLSWDMRIKVAIGAARGLHFLHTLEKKVIHRDIKTANIMLDSNYNAIIIDFGMAFWEPSDGDSHVTTMSANMNISGLDPSEGLWPSFGSYFSTQVQGTFAYVDPDYFRTGQVHVKSDVYSFGVVLLELMTGLQANDSYRPKGQQSLVNRMKPILLNERELENMMDSTMEGQYSSKAMLLTAKLASECIEDDCKKRPSMGRVLKVLQQIDALKEIADYF